MPGVEIDADTVLDLMFELGQLKRLPRSGWFRAGVDHPESVADHNLRAAQLAYVLAEMEGHPDPAKVCAMVVFHEIGECRVSDLDHVAKRYTRRAEDEAAQDMLLGLGQLGEELFELWDDCEHQKTQAGQIAKDADKLECAIQALEYIDNGHKPAQAWIDDTREVLVTDSAKRLIDALDGARPTRWWEKLELSGD